MDAQVLERRHFRRTDVDASVQISRLDADGSLSDATTAPVRNVSLAGVYCYVKVPSELKVGDPVICSLSVAPVEARTFPFARLHSKVWVARVEPIHTGRRAGETSSAEQLIGVAIAFASDATALATFE